MAAHANTGLSTLALLASSDLLAVLPRQWSGFLANSDAVQRIAIAEALPTAPICCVRRTRLPLTPAAEHLCDLFRRAAVRQVATLLQVRASLSKCGRLVALQRRTLLRHSDA